MQTQGVFFRIHNKRWLIGTDSEREIKKSVPSVCLDHDNDDYNK